MAAFRIFLGIMVCMTLFAAIADAQQAKKKLEPREGPAGDRDGKENVRGAIWEITARKVEKEDEKDDEKTGSSESSGKKKAKAKAKAKAEKEEEQEKREVFRFRHQLGVVYNLKGDKIGALSHVNSDPKFGVKSRLVLNEFTPLIGEMVMTQSKIGVWGGVFKTKTGEEWNCVIKVLDR